MIKLVNEPDYREVEVCKPLHHRRRRSPHGFLDHHLAHGHPYHECEKEKKEVRMKRSELRFDQKTEKVCTVFCRCAKWCLQWKRKVTRSMSVTLSLKRFPNKIRTND